MIVGVPRERREGETRVALVPREARRLVESGHEVRIERDAGRSASYPDAEYREAGAAVTGDAASALEGADAVLKVRPPLGPDGEGDEGDAGGPDEVALLGRGCVLVGFLEPHTSRTGLERLAERGVTGLALELLPRITRAQSMDALSSQTTVAGYKAAVLAAASAVKFFPMLTTAAGTIRPAKVLVLGAGVAGLQAIATARRLGAEVEAFDIRPEVKEQVESLGASFLEWEGGEDEVATEEGYAKEVSEETEEAERRMVAEHAAAADVVITSALVQGRSAPVLLTRDTVERMRPGSVVVDLAAPNGGNCEASEPGRTIEVGGVRIHAPLNLPASLPFHASQMYARNVTSLLSHLTREEELVIDLEDEITDAVCVTHDGAVRFGA